MGEDYYYDDYMYEVEDAKPIPLPPMPLMTNPKPRSQSFTSLMAGLRQDINRVTYFV